jgi:hypothetical protein
MRRGHGAGRTVATIGDRECLRGVAFGLLRRKTRPHIFSRFEMRFGAPDRGLRRIQIRRARGREAGGGGRRDRLARIAQFLHGGSAGTAGQAQNTNDDGEKSEHI